MLRETYAQRVACLAFAIFKEVVPILTTHQTDSFLTGVCIQYSPSTKGIPLFRRGLNGCNYVAGAVVRPIHAVVRVRRYAHELRRTVLALSKLHIELLGKLGREAETVIFHPHAQIRIVKAAKGAVMLS